MRKLVFIVIAACMAMISTACYHSTNSANTATDSTEVVMDSTLMDSAVVDSTAIDSVAVDSGVVVE